MNQFEPNQTETNPDAENTPILIEQRNVLVGIIAVLAILLIVAFYFLVTTDNNTNQPDKDPEPITNPINEEVTFEEFEDFTSSYEVTYVLASGNSEVESLANNQVKQIVKDFKDQADLDRQMVLAEEGELPTYLQRPYILNIEADSSFNNELKTESIELSIYAYQGGANGNGSYQVITLDGNGEQINSLAEIINTADRPRVKSLVIDYLEKKSFGDNSGSEVLFPESLQNLSLQDVKISFNSESLVTYFDEYQVGPGVVGGFTLEIPLEEIGEYLEL